MDLIWWRRVRANQKIGVTQFDEHTSNLINNDCRGTVAGLLESNFNGKWISRPEATDKASNKIYQLQVAQQCGFRVPETLISQNRQEVIDFKRRLNKQIIVKPVVGASGPLIFTQFMEHPEAYPQESFTHCPATYQEYIKGSHHIRLNCFGDTSFAALIETDVLDWRPNLNIPISAWNVPRSLHKKVRKTLDALGLTMGIIDIKITPEGEFVWLEVNPQGQFLFLEPLIDLPLTQYFADYLIEELQNITATKESIVV